MPRIPSIQKFKGDNEVNFQQWILQFEAQRGALEIPAGQNRRMLLYCLDVCVHIYTTSNHCQRGEIRTIA